MSNEYSLQDFSLINTYVDKIKDDYSFPDRTQAFYFFVMNMLYSLQDDEIRDAITDNHFLKTNQKEGGHDRGIDVVYIDDSDSRAHIHLFNFKFTEKFEKTQSNFPSGEVDKILGYLSGVMQQNIAMLSHINPSLKLKTEEIWEIFRTQNPEFTIHLCSNLYHGLEAQEKRRFEDELRMFSNCNIKEHLITEWVNLITRRGKRKLNAKIRAIDKNYFEKSYGDIRALIANFDAKDLVRIILDNDALRDRADLEDYELLAQSEILEDAFEDNVRVYLKQRTKINRNIKETALSDERHRFFYYNNGITITCDKFKYDQRRAPIVEIENIQVVNGSQTLHALFEAFKEDTSCLDDIDLLVRIYETENDQLTTRIAEYTNSQNPVSSRDIRAIDYMQIKLEVELNSKGYFYERKKNQFNYKPKKLRIDAEKAGQVLMAFYNELPSEAKNNKSTIFSDKYDDVFNDQINASKLLLPFLLYEKIEDRKNIWRENNAANSSYQSDKIYLSYATYYILYVFKKINGVLKCDYSEDNLEEIWAYYELTLSIIEKTIRKEKKVKTAASLMSFFKHGKPKKYIEDMIESGEIERLVKGFTV
jgi:hypothetical protein